MIRNSLLLISSLLLFACQKDTKPISWQMGPFIKVDDHNPILNPEVGYTFFCPIREDVVAWEKKDVFNPAAIVKGDSVYLLYRAEDTIGKYQGTSRIGLAASADGINFTKRPAPVLYPDNDDYYKYEWEGGCEDPRIVEDENGRYYMNYTAYDGDKARLFVASSDDLINWTKHGSVFKKHGDGELVNIWSKAGAVLTEIKDGRLLAKKLSGKYWMYFGESNMYLASSDNLIDWDPIYEDDPQKQQYDTLRKHDAFKILFGPRSGYFDSYLVEAGPPPVWTEKGIVLIYNSRNAGAEKDPNLPEGTYAAGQVLIDPNNPEKILERTDTTFFKPDKDYEITGQVNNVCFLQGLVLFEDQWFLYYGTADSKIAVAKAKSGF
jgi:predicted GH43/DUF377 family glycosyl hydrolase